ncbi:MAG TPA: hypothetical protein PKC99_14935 [Anaerolineales bacterium]|nr:hypothetical protein [Chloroflexota bacterium]MCZ7549884.1 hypothetical protein [Anaerolineales bacterium]HMN00302.1 hypothetical protein [Anaerolineales bacterium]
MENQTQIPLLRMLLARLERVSADSRWAHRASGIREALLVLLERLETGAPTPSARLDQLMDSGFQILVMAAREK